jgi:NTE family protein
MKASKIPHHKKINLALQGGGAHGAYTWGVLDRLLEEPDVEINGISGTSAGAMNAAVLACGYTKGGNQAARDALERFWRDVSGASLSLMTGASSPMAILGGGYNLRHSPAYNAMEFLTSTFSPYELNPFNINPLRTILEQHVDVDALRDSKIPLFVAATAVRTGQPRVFHCDEVTPDSLLASACLPAIFQAVEIDGEPYWDGGYMGNPVIWPLIYNTDVSDVLLVQINPLFRPETPKTAYDIANRLNEITFNSSLIAEMRAIQFVSKLVQENRLDPDKYRDVRMHAVLAGDALKDLDASSKMNASWDFLLFLRDKGRAQMDTWLTMHKQKIGVTGTIDIQKTFLDNPIQNNKLKRSKK